MFFKEKLAKMLAFFVYIKTKSWSKKPTLTQKKVFKYLIKKAEKTQFGINHNFKNISTFESFAKNVPIRTYEEIKPYIERIKNGEKNILWPGKPLYFAKTSGTTSGVKYIPITRESMPSHVQSARDATLHYINETGKASFLNKKIIFLQGSPALKEKNGIKIGRLSGIVAHYTPKYLRKNVLPSWETNCIDDWERKVEKISAETLNSDMGVIGGIPPWVQMYFEKLKDHSSKELIKDIFPNFELFVYGGVNYDPYKKIFQKLIGRKIDSIEYYPASEGFFAFQDKQKEKGMLLLLNSGIYYEFVELNDMKQKNPKRYNVGNVKMGINYVLIVSTSAGLWGYNTGDTVEFVSLSPHKILVTGRYEHFISAFGEHVISSEVENAMTEALKPLNCVVIDFTVAPKIEIKKEASCHEWWVEFESRVARHDLKTVEKRIENTLMSQNVYYKELIDGKVLSSLKVVPLKKGAFKRYMKKRGRLGGQNKLPRLSNGRQIVDELFNEVIKV